MEKFIGTVVKGKQLGRTLGFPTANLETDAAPARGVYVVVAETGGARYRAVMNVGSHPTAPEGPPTIEVHILGFAGDLYGQKLAIEPVALMRGEKKFASLDALKEQLKKDCAMAETLVSL